MIDDAIENPVDEPEDDGGVSFLATARARWERAETWESANRSMGLDDLRFKAGDQWPEAIRARRQNEQRPCLTINKMPTFVHQITNDQRQNRPAINVSPIGDEADVQTARILKGLIREIERRSDADIAYDTGFDSAVSNGWGFWRVLADYESPESFDQVLKIVRVRNPFTVYLDPMCQMPDASDINWAFVSELIPRAEFKAQWPDADPLNWDEYGVGDTYKDWVTEDQVRIAEYWLIEKDSKRLVYLANGHEGFYDDLDDSVKAQIKADPEFIVKERMAEVPEVHCYKITAHDILEENEWPGKWIPIIRCLGDEIDLEGKPVWSGIIRNAKDPQRQKNYWSTAKTEMIALAPKAPFVVAEGQIEGHESEWFQANTVSTPVLQYKPTDIAGTPVPPPQRQPFAGAPEGIIVAERDSEQDMMATTGVRFDATKSERLQDESGIALQTLRDNQQLGSYHYIDNLARGLKFTGRIIIDLIPHYYDTQRVLTILREDGSEEVVKVDPTAAKAYQEVRNQQSGKVQKIFNPNVGKYDVTVTVGPNYATKRQEATASMLEFMKVVPNSGTLIGDLVAKNQDWPESEQVSKRLAMTLPPGMLTPDSSDLSPQAQAMIAQLQQQNQQAQQQMQMMHQALVEKDTQHQIDQAKIQADYAAKMEANQTNLVKIAADMEMHALDHVNERLDLILTNLESREAREQQAMPPTGGMQ